MMRIVAPRISARAPRVLARGRPHLLEIVEGADFGPEDVDDDVYGVDQHPIALAHAFHPHAGDAGLLDVLDDMVSNGTDMALRAAGSDHHVIADGRFAAEIDDNAVLGLHVVKTREDCFEHLLGSWMPGDGFGRMTPRPRECRCAQGCWSFRCVALAPGRVREPR